MAKTGKSAKSLTDDWIKQVVTGQRHKLAHYADGDYVERDEPTPLGFAKYLMRGAKMLPLPELSSPAPAPAPAPAPEAPLAINSIPGDPGSTVGQLRSNWKKIDEASGYKNGGCVKRMEKGGDVDGPGTGTSDSVPAMLSDGEYVLPADTVDAVGKATLDKLKNATHTPVHKSKGFVTLHAADGAYIGTAGNQDLSKYLNPARYTSNTAPSVADIENRNASLGAKLNAESVQGLHNEAGAGSDFSHPNPNSSGYYAVTHAIQAAPPLAATPSPEPTPAPAAPAPASPAPAAAMPISAPGIVQRPNLISESERLVNTPGLGLAGLGLAKRVASGAGGERSAEISGQYSLQNTAMTANERLEQAKLVEHQRQQNLATWTPDKNMMGELLGYGRTKGGTPEYVTKESLMPKPAIAEGAAGKDAHNRPVVYKNGTWVAKQ
jgi:hypothetical protein